ANSVHKPDDLPCIFSQNCFTNGIAEGWRSGGLANDSDAVSRINEYVLRLLHDGESFEVTHDASDFNVIFPASYDYEITLFLYTFRDLMNPAHERASRIDQPLIGRFQDSALFVAESMSGDYHVRC